MKKSSKNLNNLVVQAPSNIAFIKYWGKFGVQYPINPSLSMTLSECRTITEFKYHWEADSFSHTETLFEGEQSKAFHERLTKYFKSLIPSFPELNKLAISISSKNTFPHSAGIASSASAYGAIGYGLSKILSEKSSKNIEDLKLASQLARLGSGSAARSIEGPYVRWGVDSRGEGSNDYAQIIKNIHPSFEELCDAILLVDTGEKAVSSSSGHALMDNHIYKDVRVKQANKNFDEIVEAMIEGDFLRFGEILENEALSLHALMMSSYPSYLLLKPNSLNIIEKVRQFRKDTKCPLYFTIDAGPNIHLIYPASKKDSVEKFIEKELKGFCSGGKYILDKVGLGASANDK